MALGVPSGQRGRRPRDRRQLDDELGVGEDRARVGGRGHALLLGERVLGEDVSVGQRHRFGDSRAAEAARVDRDLTMPRPISERYRWAVRTIADGDQAT